jgi:hypothetical protein
MSDVTEQFLGPFAGHIEPSEAERLDNLEAAARDGVSVAGVGFSSPSGLDAGRRLRSGRTYGGSAREVPLGEPVMPAAGLFMDDGFVFSPTSLALASRFTRAPYDPSMIRPCRREYSCVEGGLRCSYALAPAADYDMSVLDLVIAGSLRGLHVVEVDEEDRDHCVVRVFRSPPRDDGKVAYSISIFNCWYLFP